MNEAVVEKLAVGYRGHCKSALGANETTNQHTAVERIHCETSMKAAQTHFAALHWFQSMGELYDPLQPLHELLCKQEHRGVIQSPLTVQPGSANDAQCFLKRKLPKETKLCSL